MIVAIETNELSVKVKDGSAETIEDFLVLASRAASAIFEEDVELQLVDTPDDDAVYIEPDQPKDHVQHEGM